MAAVQAAADLGVAARPEERELHLTLLFDCIGGRRSA
jgi:hypothetical protein